MYKYNTLYFVFSETEDLPKDAEGRIAPERQRHIFHIKEVIENSIGSMSLLRDYCTLSFNTRLQEIDSNGDRIEFTHETRLPIEDPEITIEYDKKPLLKLTNLSTDYPMAVFSDQEIFEGLTLLNTFPFLRDQYDEPKVVSSALMCDLAKIFN